MLDEMESLQDELAERLKTARDAACSVKLDAARVLTESVKERLAVATTAVVTERDGLRAELRRLQDIVRRARRAAGVAATLIHEIDSAMLEVRAPLSDGVEKLNEQLIAVNRIVGTYSATFCSSLYLVGLMILRSSF
tara:strand:- start:468 stop:878 length:411 start_codon:yes stop_codon:yes gene_type:complete